MAQEALRPDKHEGAFDASSAVRLWLRMLSCTSVAEKRLRRRFAEEFDTTLPRFDVLAALDREDGLSMGELSQRLLVSNGNVTAIVRELVRQGHVMTEVAARDRRSQIVKLTPAGRAHFAELAAAHHGWIEEMLADVPEGVRQELFQLLSTVRRSLDRSEA